MLAAAAAGTPSGAPLALPLHPGIGRARSGDPAAMPAARAVSAVVAGLMVSSSLSGLRNPAAYQQQAAVVALFRGYDAVTLLVAAPALIAALHPAYRHSVRGQLVWLGMLAFAVYDYAYYVLGPASGTASASHRALFAASVLALGLGLAGIDTGRVAAAFSPGLRTRTVAVVLLGLGAALGAMWAALLGKAATTGGVLGEPSKLIVPPDMTRLGAVLDLTLLVPGYLTAGVLLWRRQPWGPVLATVLALSGTVHQLAYMSALGFQSHADIPGAPGFDPAEPPIAAAFAAAAASLLAAVKSECSGPPRRGR